MKKVGIMTFHYAYNFGALMQTYALRKTIMNMGGMQVDVINYKPATFRNKDEDILDKGYLIQKKKIDNFAKKNLGIETEPTSNLNNIGEYDYYITGSDQVWNPELPVFEETSEYFLDFVPDDKVKIAYAASIGLRITEDFNTKLFEKNIPRFDYLSVREQSYVSFIEQFTKKKCYGVFDPSFLLDKKYYEELIPDKESEKDYVMCVTYAGAVKRKVYDMVNRFSIKKNYKVVHMEKEKTPYLFLNEEETIHYAGVEEMLWAVKNANIIITDSFHFMAFSIIFHKPFFVMSAGPKNSRVNDLLEYLGLQDRVLADDLRLDDLEKEIDYERVDELIKAKRELSLEFLRMALDV